jgi:hypothetical protein
MWTTADFSAQLIVNEVNILDVKQQSALIGANLLPANAD